jgi:hypothetical protein
MKVGAARDKGRMRLEAALAERRLQVIDHTPSHETDHSYHDGF